jgi:hypothetical protein
MLFKYFNLLLATVLSLQVGLSQVSYLSENVGAPAEFISVADYVGWQMTGQVQFTGTAEVRYTNTSSNYSLSSGGGNVFIPAVPGRFFSIDLIPIHLKSSFQLSFGIFKSSTQSDGSDLVIEYSADGLNYSPLNYALLTGVGTAIWSRISLIFNIVPSTHLFIRFRQTGSITHYRIDDIIISDASTLPVRIMTFGGSYYRNSVELNWATTYEANNNGFEVQRSVDGLNYRPIGFVNSSAIDGNSQAPLKYSFTDVDPIGLKQFYRLKQIDIDGRSFISKILLIQGERAADLEIASVYPNPARSLVTLLLNAPDNRSVKIQLVDLAGRILQTRQVNVLAGNNSIPFDISNLAKGQYLISAGKKSVKVVRE